MLPVGASGASVLVSELPDTLSLAYLRRIRFAGRATGGKSLLLQKTEKTATYVTVFFWRSRRDLNSRAGYPTYTLSRGASSPLEYYSKPMI